MSTAKLVRVHNKTVVWGVYRDLLRAIGKAFKKDESTIFEARRHARECFNVYAEDKFYGTIEAEQGVEHAKGVTQILRENVVQGSKDKDDVNAPYKLNIHEEIERGDNESVKQFKGTQKSFKSMKA